MNSTVDVEEIIDPYITNLNDLMVSISKFLLSCQDETGFRRDAGLGICQTFQDHLRGIMKILNLHKSDDGNIVLKEDGGD